MRKTYKWPVGCEGGAVERSFGAEGLDDHEVFGIVYLNPTPVSQSITRQTRSIATYPCGLILAARDAVCPVRAHLQVRNDITMCALVVVDLLARLHVELRDLARLVSSDDHVGDVGEGADGRLRTDRVEHMEGLF